MDDEANKQLTKPFQVRWNESLGKPECPYLRRWVFIFFGFSIRLHHWISSDDQRYFHDHPWNFISIIFKGSYKNVTPTGTVEFKAPAMWKSDGMKQHYVVVPPSGAWTLLLCSRPYRKWGFWVNGKLWRPLRYFSKFGPHNKLCE